MASSKKTQKPKSQHEERVARFLTLFYGQEKKLSNKLRPVLANLKDDYTLSEIIAVAKALDKHPVAYGYFYGNPLPVSYAELRNTRYTYETNLEKEFNWNIVSLFKFSSKINLFIKYRDQYEHAFLIGDYLTAGLFLDKIESEICYSLWGMEQRFIIAELKGGLKENKDFLSVINNTSQDPIVTTFAYFFSNRSENKMSVQRFNNFFNNFFYAVSNDIREYFQFVVNALTGEEFKEVHSILSYDYLSSVIDRYVTYIKISQNLLARNHEIEVVKRSFPRVQKVIKDRLLDSLQLSASVFTSVDNLPETDKAITIFDHYTKGSYGEALILSKNFIRSCPSEISIYEIYIKSHIFLKKEFVGAISNDCLVNQVLDNMYNIFERNENTIQSLTSLLKIATMIQNTSFGIQLSAFYGRSVLDNKNLNWKASEIFNSQVLNPLLVRRFSDKNAAEKYLNYLLNANPLSPTIKLFSHFLKPKGQGSNSDNGLLEIPDYRKLFYQAESLKEVGMFEDAATLYRRLISFDGVNIVLFEDGLVNLLECCLKTEKYEEYLKIYIDHYFINANLLIRVETKQVIQQLQVSKFKNVKASILLPVFFYITKQDSHNINIALRVFLKDLGIERSVSLKTKLEVLNSNFLKFLLYNICTPEILKYSVYFTGTREILLERVEVLQILVSIDKSNSVLYDSEISKITQNLAVIDAIRQIDESKIYVDEKSLINSEFSDIKNNYSRYIEIGNLVGDHSSSFIDISLNRQIILKVTDKNIIAQDLGHSRVSKNVRFELFKEVFFEIRDSFLFNNRYGLDVYLSTRIRHGTLLGQFRNEFQAQHLITQKDKLNETYFRNDYWDKKLENLDDDRKDKIQILLSDFSEKVDKTANDLKERAIQIKTEDRNRLGLFDFTIPNERLLVYYHKVFKDIDNYDDFITVSFQFFWRMTNLNLDFIRQYISENVKNRLLEFLSTLEVDLGTTVIDEKDIQELLNHIKTCKTQIHLELDKIADWFKIRQNIIPDFNISKVINSCLEITNKISQNTKILDPKIELNCPTTFKGQYFIHLFDLLRIFSENIVNYSELNSSELKVKLKATEQDDLLHIVITNNLNSNIDLDTLRSKFNKKKEELSNANWDMDKIRTEKDTGFYKAKKNLISDLRDETNYFDFKVNENGEVEVNIYINSKKLSI